MLLHTYSWNLHNKATNHGNVDQPLRFAKHTCSQNAYILRAIFAVTAALTFALSSFISAPRPAVAATQTTAGHVTVIILDMSGSMAQNDPNGLRCSAANAYIDLSGQGDEIGVIGLDSGANPQPAAQGFQAAQTWANPVDVSTLSARTALLQTISQKSQNCRPDANTPTFDALSKAYGMLQSATSGGKTGSVILLTDGAPYPSTQNQIQAINSQLAPKFQANNWPIDTIALGSDTSFHSFLSGVSNATNGLFFDDSNGPVHGVSPLNLADFFVSIFKVRNGRSVGPTIAPVMINGSLQHDFSVGTFVSHLDIIAIKDAPAMSVTVTAPDGQTIPPALPGAFIANDPHFAIFSIDQPQSGSWRVNIQGSGMFLMDSLVVSPITVSIAAPHAGKAFPLGQPTTISASLIENGATIIGSNYQVTATITYAGSGGHSVSLVSQLSDSQRTGTYSNTVTIPLTDPAGSYQIMVAVEAASEPAASSSVVASFIPFPTPNLLAPGSSQPANGPISDTVITWDPALRFIYSLPVIGWSFVGFRPADLPLQGAAAQPQAQLNGETLLGGALYQNATVTGAATNAAGQAAAVTVIPTGSGRFFINLPQYATGKFTVTLTAQGAFSDTFGQAVSKTTIVNVFIAAPTWQDEVRAWAITLLYLLLLGLFTVFFIYGPINYLARAKPGAGDRLIDVGANLRAQNRSQMSAGVPIRRKKMSLSRYFAPNIVPASEMGLPENLQFMFRRGNEVAVRLIPSKNTAANWQIDGRNLGAESQTILPGMQLTYTESGASTKLKFEQDRSAAYTSESGASSSIGNRLQDAGAAIGARDFIRRRKGLRND